jgi:TRAP-type C4-dicarboxylate transport system permease large subunit
VLFIVTAASIFAWLLTVSQAAQMLSDAIFSITQNKWVFLLLANLLMLFVGCFIDTIAAITILVPILLPIVLKLGIDPIHFGLIMTLNLMIGLLHPPLGMVLFVLARVARFRSSAPPWRSCPGSCRCCGARASPTSRSSPSGCRGRWGSGGSALPSPQGRD